MKKVLLLMFVGIGFLSSCKTNALKKDIVENKEVNYIPYYLKVYEAKNYYDSKEFEKSFNILDSLFQYYEPIETPTIYEMEIYCELAVKFKKYSEIKKVLRVMIVKYGRKPYEIVGSDDLWSDIILHSKYTKSDFENFHKEYLKKINYSLKDTIVEMFKRDQLYRKKGNNYNPSKFDSIDKINGSIFFSIIKKYGYPRENIIGGMELNNSVKPSFLSTILMHLNYNFYNQNLKDLLFNELKKGKINPLDYATMLDKFYVQNTDKITDYTYMGTYLKPVNDTIKTNIARKNIGLPKL